MKFTVNLERAARAAESLLRVVPVNSPMPELRGFLVEADEKTGVISLSANNLEAAARRTLKAKVSESGAAVIPAKIMTDMLTKMEGEDVAFYAEEGGRVAMKASNCLFATPVMSAGNFPLPQAGAPAKTCKVSGLRALYAQTALAVNAKIESPALAGVHLEIYSDCVRAAGADGARLALAQRPIEGDGQFSVTVPKASLQYLADASSGADALEVGLCGQYLVFQAEGFWFSTRMIAESYIDAEKILDGIPADYTALVSGKKTLEALGAIGVVFAAEEAAEKRRLNVRFGIGEISFSAKNDCGKSDVSVSARVSAPTPDGGFWYDYRKFADAFKTVGAGEVELSLSKQGALVFKTPEARYMLIPTRAPAEKKTIQKKKKDKAA
jgi:DNA polymerase-3 subunit beta